MRITLVGVGVGGLCFAAEHFDESDFDTAQERLDELASAVGGVYVTG